MLNVIFAADNAIIVSTYLRRNFPDQGAQSPQYI